MLFGGVKVNMSGLGYRLTELFGRWWSQYAVLRFGSRAVVALILARFCLLAVQSYLTTRQLNYLLLTVSEIFTVGLVILARDTKKINLSPVALLATVGGTFYYVLFDFSKYSSLELIAPEYGLWIQCVSIIMQVAAKASLGLSFGLVPANRGIKSAGAYRFVRHPIYASYLVGHVGFILSHFNYFNLAVLAFNWFCQVIRIFEEEKVLRRDPAYVAYASGVRWRLIPGVF